MTEKVTPVARLVAPRPIVALVAHDRRKEEMVQWATFNKGTLSRCTIYATRTTGLTLQSALDTPIQLMLSGPMGGDAQLGSLIAEGRIDAVFFFWDPLTPQPHDVVVEAREVQLALGELLDLAAQPCPPRELQPVRCEKGLQRGQRRARRREGLRVQVEVQHFGERDHARRQVALRRLLAEVRERDAARSGRCLRIPEVRRDQDAP